MADLNKTAFAVSVTPKMSVDAEEGIFQAMTVINEDVRKSLGGSGDITGGNTTIGGGVGGSWVNGVYTQCTNSSNGGELTGITAAATNMVFIKHLGTLVSDGSASAATDTLKVALHGDDTAGVTGDGVIIAELKNGEAMILPNPGIDMTIKFVSGVNHVNVECLTIGT